MNPLEEVKHLRTDPGGQHYNCAQSLLRPFAPLVGLDPAKANELGRFFGSGMMHGSTCGVLSSALMLLGMAGYDQQQAGELIRRFREEHGATDCATLLTQSKARGVDRKSHCDGLVLEMAQLLDTLLEPQP